MELRDVTTNAEGLKRLIEFLHSPENIIHIDAERPSDMMVFYLENAKWVEGPGIHDEYNVSIRLIQTTGNKMYVSRLLDLIKKIGE